MRVEFAIRQSASFFRVVLCCEVGISHDAISCPCPASSFAQDTNASGLVAMALSALPAGSAPAVLSACTDAVSTTGSTYPRLCVNARRFDFPRVGVHDRACTEAQDGQRFQGCQGGQVSRPVPTLPPDFSKSLRPSWAAFSVWGDGLRWRALISGTSGPSRAAIHRPRATPTTLLHR